MDTEKSISELIREAREDNNKLIVLLAGEATEKSMLAIARVANKIKEEMAELDYEPFLVSAKKEYGVPKNKKSFSPPKNKGFNKGKVVLRGRHR